MCISIIQHRPRYTQGRSSAASEVTHKQGLSDGEVSRRHARFEAEDGVLYVTDLRSSNGTFLNGEPVSDSVEIRRGDTIDVGNVRLTVLGTDVAP